MKVNLSKSKFYAANVMYLGHVVGGGVVQPNTASIEAILSFPVPQDKKQLQRSLGMAGY